MYTVVYLIVSALIGLFLIASIAWSVQPKTKTFGRFVFLGLSFAEIVYTYGLHFWAFGKSGDTINFSTAALGCFLLAAYFAWDLWRKHNDLRIALIQSLHDQSFWIQWLKMFALFVSIQLIVSSASRAVSLEHLNALSFVLVFIAAQRLADKPS